MCCCPPQRQLKACSQLRQYLACPHCSQVEATTLGTTNMSVNSSGSTLGSAPYTKNLMRLINR